MSEKRSIEDIVAYVKELRKNKEQQGEPIEQIVADIEVVLAEMLVDLHKYAVYDNQSAAKRVRSYTLIMETLGLGYRKGSLNINNEEGESE